jgi:hypothetical protein
VLGMAGIYAKGKRDQIAKHKQRQEEAVNALEKKYDTIEKRPDDVDHVKGRLNKGTF